MDSLNASLTPNMLISAGILIAAYIVIFSEIIHRTSVAIIASVIMIIVGMATGFYSQE